MLINANSISFVESNPRFRVHLKTILEYNLNLVFGSLRSSMSSTMNLEP
ncbi:hypothetical protein D1AOALGA4SA_6680 [Olavius algarvensis Delta 1 endosymbiont]|nr:hypothetical protein D1AOALGA4SA_6680 [Olavius algarvensis Delta 1 endosymbiont]